MKSSIESTVRFHENQLDDMNYVEAWKYLKDLIYSFESAEDYYRNNPLYDELVRIHNEVLNKINKIVGNKQEI